MTSQSRPAFDAPDACYVCGSRAHGDETSRGGHRFVSNTEAEAQFAAEAARGVGVTGAEARYVATHRPY